MSASCPLPRHARAHAATARLSAACVQNVRYQIDRETGTCARRTGKNSQPTQGGPQAAMAPGVGYSRVRNRA